MKKPVLKGYTLYDSIYITFLKQQNDRDENSGCHPLKRDQGGKGCRCGYEMTP